MREPLRSKQRDLFAAPVAASLSLPALMRAALIDSLAALLLEVMAHPGLQVREARQEACDEQQDHR